mgnify:CR=1 FL=1
MLNNLLTRNEVVCRRTARARRISPSRSAETVRVNLRQDLRGLRADVIQRKPIARVSTNASYYVDDEGKYMPLSTNYTAHVPIVTGSVEKNNLKNIFTIASKIYEDEFLKTHIVEIHQEENQRLSLKTRVFNFEIILGDLNDLDKKINNLKAFYQKAKKDETLNTYSKVNLQFNNQVVCTKK